MYLPLVEHVGIRGPAKGQDDDSGPLLSSQVSYTCSHTTPLRGLLETEAGRVHTLENSRQSVAKRRSRKGARLSAVWSFGVEPVLEELSARPATRIAPSEVLSS